MFTKRFEDYHFQKNLWITVNVHIPLINHFIWLSQLLEIIKSIPQPKQFYASGKAVTFLYDDIIKH